MREQERLHNLRKGAACCALTFHLEILGCPKNQTDGEGLKRLLLDAGFRSGSIDEAGFYLILTCGFIESAKKEAIDEILKAVAAKKRKPELKIVVMGCLAERYSEELYTEIPEVDAVLGLSENHRLVTHLKRISEGGRFYRRGAKSDYQFNLIRELDHSRKFAYLKLSEGCDNRCSYCAIPSIKGPLRSRKVSDILSEARQIDQAGFKEIILVAQDSTRYGFDLAGKTLLPGLLENLAGETTIPWIRLMYAHPAHLDAETIEIFRKLPDRLLPYLDLPIQHADSRILKLMGRNYAEKTLTDLIKRLRDQIPGLVLRSTVMVGFPGEGRKELQTLLRFIEKIKLERVGVFRYSPEEGTASYEMKAPSARAAAAREQRILTLQAGISAEFNQSRLHRKYRVLVEEKLENLPFGYQGRSFAEAPEIDPVIFFNSRKKLKSDFTDVIITGAQDYDLEGTAC
ncbi:MAG: 30S ribosomal protein S12 methylthiotransferase RimO [Candidatus Wallbacteria bacterium]|nr:30S ribosomal protein S12 methylthiotransferase RimO [Candidatus Wallbacteria bacterium]